jgi:hypothetical protein
VQQIEHHDQGRRHAEKPQNQRSSHGSYLLTRTNSRFRDRFLTDRAIRAVTRR